MDNVKICATKHVARMEDASLAWVCGEGPRKQHASHIDMRSLTPCFDCLIQVTKWGIAISGY
jgi:hypothetical protein